MKKILSIFCALFALSGLAEPLYTFDWSKEILSKDEIIELVGEGGGVNREAVIDIFNDIFTNDASRVMALSNMFDNVSHKYIENINGEAYGLMVAEATNVTYSAKKYRFSFNFQQDSADTPLWSGGSIQLIFREDDLKELIRLADSPGDREGVSKCDVQITTDSPIMDKSYGYGSGLRIDQVMTRTTDKQGFFVNAVQIDGEKYNRSFPLGGVALFRIEWNLGSSSLPYDRSGNETIYLWFSLESSVAIEMLDWMNNPTDSRFFPTNATDSSLFFFRPTEDKRSDEPNTTDFGEDDARVYLFGNMSTNHGASIRNVILYRDTTYETVMLPYGPMSPVITEWHLNIATNSWNEKIDGLLDNTLSNWVNSIAASTASNRVNEVTDDLLGEIRNIVNISSNTLEFVSNTVESIHVDATNLVSTSIVEVVRTAYRDATSNITELVIGELPSAAQIAYIAATNVENRIGNTDSAAYALRAMRTGYVEKYHGAAVDLSLATDVIAYTNSIMHHNEFLTTNLSSVSSKVFPAGTTSITANDKYFDYSPNNRLFVRLSMDGAQQETFERFIAGDINPASLDISGGVVATSAERVSTPLMLEATTLSVHYMDYEQDPFLNTYVLPLSFNNSEQVIKTERSVGFTTVSTMDCLATNVVDLTSRDSFLGSFDSTDPFMLSDAAFVVVGRFIGVVSSCTSLWSKAVMDKVVANAMMFDIGVGRFTSRNGENRAGLCLIPLEGTLTKDVWGVLTPGDGSAFEVGTVFIYGGNIYVARVAKKSSGSGGKTMAEYVGAAANVTLKGKYDGTDVPYHDYGLLYLSSYRLGLDKTMYLRYVGDAFTTLDVNTNSVSSLVYLPGEVVSSAASVNYVADKIDDKINELVRTGIEIDGTRYTLEEVQ